MGHYYAGKIITEGLVLCLDATNSKSYPGSGVNWYDISGNGNHGTLVNTPTFDVGSGSMVFDGSNQYVNFDNPLDQTQFDQVWTFQGWIDITTNASQIFIGGLNRHLYIEFAQGDNSLLYLNSGADDYYTYGGQFTAQGWVFATFRFNNNTGDREIWRNLTNITTGGPNATSTPSGQSATFTLSSATEAINGKVANVLGYNRYLSDNEIRKNYNALKGRFGQ